MNITLDKTVLNMFNMINQDYLPDVTYYELSAGEQ